MPSNNSTPHLPEDYNLQVRKTIPYYDSIHWEVINLVRSLGDPPRIWLDTGCGTGAMIRLALEEMPGTEFILVDPSKDMLEVARIALKQEGRAHILGPLPTQGLLGKLEVVPDLITAIQCHHYLSKEEREKAVKVCFELLPPNGTFITFENVRPRAAFDPRRHRHREKELAELPREERSYRG